jgi:hypothetical protein
MAKKKSPQGRRKTTAKHRQSKARLGKFPGLYQNDWTPADAKACTLSTCEGMLRTLAIDAQLAMLEPVLKDLASKRNTRETRPWIATAKRTLHYLRECRAAISENNVRAATAFGVAFGQSIAELWTSINYDEMVRRQRKKYEDDRRSSRKERRGSRKLDEQAERTLADMYKRQTNSKRSFTAQLEDLAAAWNEQNRTDISSATIRRALRRQGICIPSQRGRKKL